MNITEKRSRLRYKLKIASKLPTVVVNKTNQYFFGQALAYENGIVLGAVHEKTFASKKKAKPVELAKEMGLNLGKQLMDKGIKKVAFDRSGYVYHGKVKAFADGLRESGLIL